MTLIIAEAGVNHNGDACLAKELIDIAAECGADIVKFQTFKAEELVTKKAKKAEQRTKMGTVAGPARKALVIVRTTFLHILNDLNVIFR